MLDLGGVTIAALTDAHGSFATFRGAFGDAFEDEPWALPFRAFLVRTEGATVLVDTGIGPQPGAFLPDRQGWLPQALADMSVTPRDVDTVVLTHLHVDHVGWCAVDGSPFFANARYVVARDDWAFFEERDASRGVFAEKLAPLDPDLIELRERDVAPRVTMVPTPGHTPGHMSVRVRGDAHEAYVLGDVAVHTLQLADPDVAYAGEVDAEFAAKTRRAVLEELANGDVMVAAGHFPEPFGQVASDEAGYAWRGET